ncbi:hypothetical protein CHUAL_007247 [Chamberlinius hualienensis]
MFVVKAFFIFLIFWAFKEADGPCKLMVTTKMMMKCSDWLLGLELMAGEVAGKVKSKKCLCVGEEAAGNFVCD